MANLVYKNNEDKPTYIIIDLPFMCIIQYFYLSCVIGENVNLIKTKDDLIIENKINLVPLNFINDLDIRVDLFIGTYSITETNDNLVKLLKSKNFFGAEKFFFSYQTKNPTFFNGILLANELKNYLNLKEFTNGFENGNYIFK